MALRITPTGAPCGAVVEGEDLRADPDAETVAGIRRAWLAHKVLVFPGQALSDEDLERFTCCFGGFGDDPFIAAIEGHPHVIELCRRADEKAPIFAEAWHTDWSFQPVPPAGTCLYGITIPPLGGDTAFADQQRALECMPAALRAKIEGRVALHSAAAGYAPDGLYGEREKDSDRSMQIVYSEEARAVHSHPLIRRHPETGAEALFGCLGYICGIEGMEQDEALQLLMELHAWQTREEFQYVHRWSPGMLVMWDNRCLLHRANGGYDGYARVLHRTTIADRAA